MTFFFVLHTPLESIGPVDFPGTGPVEFQMNLILMTQRNECMASNLHKSQQAGYDT
jgi:hypothetical protein